MLKKKKDVKSVLINAGGRLPCLCHTVGVPKLLPNPSYPGKGNAVVNFLWVLIRQSREVPIAVAHSEQGILNPEPQVMASACPVPAAVPRVMLSSSEGPARRGRLPSALILALSSGGLKSDCRRPGASGRGCRRVLSLWGPRTGVPSSAPLRP